MLIQTKCISFVHRTTLNSKRMDFPTREPQSDGHWRTPPSGRCSLTHTCTLSFPSHSIFVHARPLDRFHRTPPRPIEIACTAVQTPCRQYLHPHGWLVATEGVGEGGIKWNECTT